ncbi:MAG: SBBP repeat-containing protein [Pyrinomonadaceae bacterium]|nr:SBBP repeat-containing protein [Pyrinomonadaceae bacterium]
MKYTSHKLITPVVFAALFVAAIVGTIIIRSSDTGKTAESTRETEFQQTSETSVENAVARLPLVFEASHSGKRTESAADFVSRGAGYRLALNPTEAVMSFEKNKTPEQETAPVPATLKMRLEKANKRAKAAGEKALTGKLNYFIGSDRKNWHTDVSAFQKVRYTAVYPGVDVIYYGKQRQLEYDFVVAPKADPNQIELAFDGAQSINISAEGALILQMPDGGEVQFEKPFSYQEVNGERREIASRYAVKENNRVGFEVAEYNRAETLVIDPVLNYFTYLGGELTDEARAVAVDNTGNFYIGGNTNSAFNLPLLNPLRGQLSAIQLGENDAFLSKFNANGELIFSTYFGGSNAPNEVNGLTVDSGGNAYLTGSTRATDFPTTANAFDNTKADSSRDAFVVKLGAAGNNLLYSSFFGGNSLDVGNAITVNETGRAFIAGETASVNLPITVNA